MFHEALVTASNGSGYARLLTAAIDEAGIPVCVLVNQGQTLEEL